MYSTVSYQPGDFLIFGSETRGLPESWLSEYPAQCLTLPMVNSAVRSLNLATAASAVLYEGVRQLG